MQETIGDVANPEAFNSLEEIAPGFGRHIVEYSYGGIFCREGLDAKQRELIGIASLTTLGGCEEWLGAHINAGLNVGLTPKEIVETIVHCSLPAGMARSLNGITVAQKVFKERNIKVEA